MKSQSVLPLTSEFELPSLPYPMDALEPFLGYDNVDILYNGYHAAYVLGLNGALRNALLPAGCSLPGMLGRTSSMSLKLQTYVAGHYNLSLFWKTLSPDINDKPTGVLDEAIQATFGGLAELMKSFALSTQRVTNNGWIWLVSRDGRLLIAATPDHRNPLMDCEPADQHGVPILGLNLWKHAYHDTYQHRLTEYTEQWGRHINWREVERLYLSTL
ncbi:superoxide dismutase [Spirosoma spitsbergense]|uniref:superoxide dismutase n=1 Tax=Spirosoma spitsbergense TaxID=431554 RepID=UPI000361F678|nr:superoxide dismutase [Spirosoma spitsbergense]